MSEQQSGWYPDPEGNASKLRYWDGNQWTSDYRDAPTEDPAPAPEATGAAVPEVDSAPEVAPAEDAVPVAAPIPTAVPVAAPISTSTSEASPFAAPEASPFAAPAATPVSAQYIDNTSNGQQGGKGLVIAGLVVGIISILCFWFPPLGIILGILAIVFGIVGLVKKKGGLAIGSLITGALGLIISIVIVVITFVAAAEIANSYNAGDFDDIVNSIQNNSSSSNSTNSSNNSNSSNSSNSSNNSSSNSNSSSSTGSAIDATILVGTWDEVDIDNIYFFNADGSGSEYFDGDTWEFTWKIEGSKLTMNFVETGVESYEIELKDNNRTLIVHNSFIDYEYHKQ